MMTGIRSRLASASPGAASDCAQDHREAGSVGPFCSPWRLGQRLGRSGSIKRDCSNAEGNHENCRDEDLQSLGIRTTSGRHSSAP